jgi:cell division protein FtsZ
VPPQHSHAAESIDLENSEEGIHISVVGIGTRGEHIAATLSQKLLKPRCDNLAGAPGTKNHIAPPELLTAMRSTDLRFLLGGTEDDHQRRLFEAIGMGLKGDKGLTVGVIPDCGERPRLVAEDLEQMNQAVDCLFKVSSECLSAPNKFLENPRNREAMTRYAMRHTVSAITELIAERGIICIDFADVAAFLRCGTIGRLGTGVATDSERGRTAAMLAITRLEDQGAPLDTARGVLACVQGSTLMTMEDFDAASLAICEVASEDNPLIIGLLTEEYLGNNVRVTILSVT